MCVLRRESPSQEKNLMRDLERGIRISLNPQNWNKKRRGRMERAFQNLKKSGYLRERRKWVISFNKSKALGIKGWSNVVLKVRNSLPLEAVGDFLEELPTLFPLLITLREMVPTNIIRDYRPSLQYKAWEYILDNVPINAVVSTDRFSSFGFSQMLASTYDGLRRAFGKELLSESYEECVSPLCQVKALYLLVYTDLRNAYFFFKKTSPKKFQKIWDSSSKEEKREFVVFLGALLVNTGWTRKVRQNVIAPALKNSNSLKELMAEIAVRANRIMKNNDSGDYALDVLKFYRYLRNRVSPSLLSPAFSESVRETQPLEEMDSFVYAGRLKKVRRKSKRTGNEYDCYIFTINSDEEEYESFWNFNMIRALLRDPTPEDLDENYDLVLGFNGLKDVTKEEMERVGGIVAIPEHLFDKEGIGEEFVVVEGKWDSYGDIVKKYIDDNPSSSNSIRYRAILYAFNNSKKASELTRVRIPLKLLRRE